MIPRVSRPAREPILNLPAVVALTVLALVAIHAVRLLLSDETDFRLIVDWAVIPARWSVALGGIDAGEVIRAVSGESVEGQPPPLALLARYVLDPGEGKPWTGLSYALLHGSWAHVLINGVWLAAFGTPIARRCGAWRFYALAAASALGGAILYSIMNPLQVLPMIGASAAVSGMMAAASWFMFAPPAWSLDGRRAQTHERPREPLAEIVRNRQVLIFLGVWFAANYVFGSVQPIGVADASVAWEAHIGGFLVGLLFFPFLDPIPPRPGRVPA